MNLADEGHLILKQSYLFWQAIRPFFAKVIRGFWLLNIFTFKYLPEGGLEPM
jgi:hypothetical protein